MSIIRASFTDCTDVFLKVENVIFALPKSILIQSEVFKDAISLPRREQTPFKREDVPTVTRGSVEEQMPAVDYGDTGEDTGMWEGTDAANPILLEDITLRDFQLLYKFLSSPACPNYWEFAVEDLITLLRLSDQLEIPHLRQRAVLLLDHHPGFALIGPIDRFSLCIEASVSHWFKATYTALAHQPFLTVTQNHGGVLNDLRIKQLGQIHASIKRQRFNYACSDAPSLRFLSERQMSHHCHALWEKEVWRGIVLLLLETENKLFRDEMRSLVYQAREQVAITSQSGRMCDECFTAYVERLEDYGFIGSEERTVEKQVDEAFASENW